MREPKSSSDETYDSLWRSHDKDILMHIQLEGKIYAVADYQLIMIDKIKRFVL
jgi:hypothetical protein